MAKPTIVTRAGKGSALTWTEGDANFTNLQDATLTIQAGSGGTNVTSDLNGTITLVAGTNVTLSGDNTAKTVTINASGGSGGISNVVEDTSPQLGGHLDVNGYQITSSSNGNIAIVPNGSGNISLTPATGHVIISAVNFPTGDGTANQVLKTNGTGDLSWATITSGISSLSADTSPSLGGNLTVAGYSIISASNGNIVVAPNGTGKTKVSAINYNEGAIYDLGTTGGTIAPDVTNGNVQKITLNSALTINGFTSPVAGQSVTLIIYGGTSYTSITSTMKFAGGIKTLTATSGCIDILTIYYDGTNYFAALGKGYA